jgi:HPt (histidine-containing phosphotransfer) domain-containing protein
VQKLAHSMKGVLLNLQLLELAALAEKLEKSSEAGDSQVIAVLVEELIFALREFVE